MSNQKYFYFDQQLCYGCEACVVACKDWNDVKPGNTSYRRKVTVEIGSYPTLKIYNALISCYHCADPACIKVCPMGAISKRSSDGAVLVNTYNCIACKACKGACPYDAPQFDDNVPDAKMQKCTMCWDRLADDTWNIYSKLPVCVTACVQRAIKFGTKSELAEQGINIDTADQSAIGFDFDSSVKPSVRFNRKK